MSLASVFVTLRAVCRWPWPQWEIELHHDAALNSNLGNSIELELELWSEASGETDGNMETGTKYQQTKRILVNDCYYRHFGIAIMVDES